MPAAPPDRPGLQPERTELSWERTAVAVLVVGGLLLVRYQGPALTPRTVLAGAAFVLAVVLGVLGRRTRRHPARAGHGRVLVAATALAAFSIATAVVLGT